MFNPICLKERPYTTSLGLHYCTAEAKRKKKGKKDETLTSTKIPSLSNDTMAGSSEGTNLEQRRTKTLVAKLQITLDR